MICSLQLKRKRPARKADLISTNIHFVESREERGKKEEMEYTFLSMRGGGELGVMGKGGEVRAFFFQGRQPSTRNPQGEEGF